MARESGLLGSSLAVLDFVLRGGECVGVVRALVVAHNEVGIASAETVVVVGSALRVACRLLRDAEVEDTVDHKVSVLILRRGQFGGNQSYV